MKNFNDGLTSEDVRKLEKMARQNSDDNFFQYLFQKMEVYDLSTFCAYLRDCDDLKFQELSNMLQWHDQSLNDRVPDPRNIEELADDLVHVSAILKEFAVFLRRQEILTAVEQAR